MDGALVRNRLRRATTATLATIDAVGGHPYASLVEIATLADSRAILLISNLARHTRNVRADRRVSLLVDQREQGSNALAAERVVILGALEPCDDPPCRERYLARYPQARVYADFADFGFWVLSPSSAHVIAGFGRIGEVPGGELTLECPSAVDLAKSELAITRQCNEMLSTSRPGTSVIGLDIEGVDFVGDGLGRLEIDLSSVPPSSVASLINRALVEHI